MTEPRNPDRTPSTTHELLDDEVAGVGAALHRAARRAQRRMAEHSLEANDPAAEHSLEANGPATKRTPPMSPSASLSAKSVQAALAAIEIYNKPRFVYREESFSILMANAWELMLKAKWVLDHEEDQTSLHDTKNGITKTNKSGNPITTSASTLSAKLLADPNSGLAQGCHNNILALLEIRNNAVHFLHKCPHLERRILEVGTASLRNYTLLAQQWFNLDLSDHDVFLMPLSFRHGFDTAEWIPTDRGDKIKNLLSYIDALEQDQSPYDTQRVAICIETKLVKTKDKSAVSFAWTDDPYAPAVTVREEDVLTRYPFTYRDLTNKLKARYSNFVENREYHRLRKPLEEDERYCLIRLLDPKRPKGSKKKFYSSGIILEFDKRYQLRAS